MVIGQTNQFHIITSNHGHRYISNNNLKQRYNPNYNCNAHLKVAKNPVNQSSLFILSHVQLNGLLRKHSDSFTFIDGYMKPETKRNEYPLSHLIRILSVGTI